MVHPHNQMNACLCPQSQSHLGLFIFLLGLLSWGGCDSAVEPFRTDGNLFFSVAGYLDTAADTQFVRIEPFRTSLTDQGLGELRVETWEENSQTRHTWQEKAITLANGDKGRLFYAVFKPTPKQTYLLRIQDAQNHLSTARVSMPETPSLVTQPPFLDGSTNRVYQNLSLRNVRERLLRADIAYRVAADDKTTPQWIVLPYTSTHSGTNTTAVDWGLQLNLSLDSGLVLQRLGTLQGYFYEIALRAERIDPLWQQRLVNPSTTLSNIENGIGFWGAIHRFELKWKLPNTILKPLNFIDKQPTALHP